MRLLDITETLRSGYLGSHQSVQADPLTGLAMGLDKLVPLVNAGVVDLYKRFMIRKETITIQCDGRDRYQLRGDTKIVDGYKVAGEINEVLEIYDDKGNLCTFDNVSRTKHDHRNTDYGLNVFMAGHNVLGVPDTYFGELRVVYKAGAERMITHDEHGRWIPMDMIMVDLPMYYLDAICLYVASRMLTSLQGTNMGRQGTSNPAQIFIQMYEDECIRLELIGLEQDVAGNSYERFESKGFV